MKHAETREYYMAELKTIFESDQKLFLLIKTAIERETSSQKMYKEALTYCSDPILHDVLERLYKDEIRHEKKLLKIYKDLRHAYNPDGKPLSKNQE